MLISEFDRVVVLCVDRRYEAEYPRLKKMIEDKGGNPEFFIEGKGDILPAEMYSQISPPLPPGWSIGPGAYYECMAIRKIFQKAKQDGIGNLLFIEDDCVLTDNFDETLGAALGQMEDMKIEWDILYYGANHSWAPTQILSSNLLRVDGSRTTHMIAFQGTVFDEMIKLPIVDAIDKNIGDVLHHQYNCVAIYPPIALQKPGVSYINNVQSNYTEFFKSAGANWT